MWKTRFKQDLRESGYANTLTTAEILSLAVQRGPFHHSIVRMACDSFYTKSNYFIPQTSPTHSWKVSTGKGSLLEWSLVMPVVSERPVMVANWHTVLSIRWGSVTENRSCNSSVCRHKHYLLIIKYCGVSHSQMIYWFSRKH